MTDFKEQHVCNKGCFKLCNTAMDTYNMLKLAFGEETTGRIQISEWFLILKSGMTFVEDSEFSGH
jgi:hypothetical protein